MRKSCFCEISALCVVDHLWILILFYLLSLLSTLWFIGPAMCNWTWCVQVYQLPQTHCGDNHESTLFSWLHKYIYLYVHTYLYIYIPIYIYIHLCNQKNNVPSPVITTMALGQLMHLGMHLCPLIYIHHIHLWKFVINPYVCVYIYICMYLYIYMYVFIYIYVCIYIYRFLYIYIYTYVKKRHFVDIS